MTRHLFVYGTLLPDLAPAHLRAALGQLRRVGPAQMSGRLYDLGPYPAAVVDPSAATRIVGAVFLLPNEPAVLAALDEYEGIDPHDPVGSLYVRVQQTAILADGSELPCWVYAYNQAPGDAPLVPDGDYVRWRAIRSDGLSP